MSQEDKKFLKDFLKFIVGYGVTLFVIFSVSSLVDYGTKYFTDKSGQDKHCSRQSDRALWKVDADCLYYFKNFHTD